MTLSVDYDYIESNIFDIKILFKVLRFIIINFILAFIFLFLIFEELDWFLFSLRGKLNDSLIDNTSWNIKKIF